jgi:hypothetical protein
LGIKISADHHIISQDMNQIIRQPQQQQQQSLKFTATTF